MRKSLPVHGTTVTDCAVQLRAGDRFTNEEDEWEVASRPWNARRGTVVHVTVQRPAIQARSAT